jgi:hypothetical protein
VSKPQAWSPVLWTGLVVVLSVAFTWLSLADVPGATRNADGTCCTTEYVRGWASLAPTLLVFPIFVIARSTWTARSTWMSRLSSWLLLVVAVSVSGASVFYIAHTGVTRIEDAGWGDGLENLAYLVAGFQLALFVAAAAMGASRRRRSIFGRSIDQATGG